MERKVLKELDKTVLKEEITQIRDIYKKLEKKQVNFCDTFCVHCAKGCGKCCEHFTPDITKAESDFLAYGLICEGKDEEVLNHLENYTNTEYCPLYIKDSEYHCTVYKWRPLVCRLFGASASQNKDGRPVFRNCKYNELSNNLATTELMESKKRDVVLMGMYGLMVDEIRGNDETRELLPTALTNSIYKIRYMLELEKESK